MMTQDGAPRTAVIGTGRCGTGYVAAMLRANAVKVAHEGWFNPYEGDPERTVSGLDVDVSWLALPDIKAGIWSGPVAHVIRHPVDVVRSFVGIGFFDDPEGGRPHSTFARIHCPEIRGLTGVEAAVEWWVAWNWGCQEAAKLTVKIEDLTRNLSTIKGLGAALDLTLAPRHVATNTNTRKRAPIEESVIWDLLDGRGSLFGYAPEEVQP